jgi:hypothetical protein
MRPPGGLFEGWIRSNGQRPTGKGGPMKKGDAFVRFEVKPVGSGMYTLSMNAIEILKKAEFPRTHHMTEMTSSGKPVVKVERKQVGPEWIEKHFKRFQREMNIGTFIGSTTWCYKSNNIREDIETYIAFVIAGEIQEAKASMTGLKKLRDTALWFEERNRDRANGNTSDGERIRGGEDRIEADEGWNLSDYLSPPK